MNIDTIENTLPPRSVLSRGELIDLACEMLGEGVDNRRVADFVDAILASNVSLESLPDDVFMYELAGRFDEGVAYDMEAGEEAVIRVDDPCTVYVVYDYGRR